MKERRIKIIVGLMAFAVIGLVGVQVYWLANLIKVEEERFSRSVSNALVSASEKFEQEEAAKILAKKVWVGKDHKQKSKVTEIKVTGTHFNYFIHDTSQQSRILKVENDEGDFVYQIHNDSTKKGNVSEIKVVSVFPGKKLNVNMNSPRIILEKKIDTFVTTKKQLVQNVVGEMIQITTQIPIEKRLSVKSINSILTREFTSKGITSEFQFGVFKVKKDSLTLLKSGTDSLQLKKSPYKTLLFPAEIFSGINELRVYFPNKGRHILSSVIGMIGLSAVFIAMIVGVFLKTVQMFIKQKKITEVKNDLINNITHEFKTPISTISLACEALNEPALISDKHSVNRYSKIIKEENERLQLMVDTLLNTASMEKDELKIDKAEIDLEEIIRTVLSKFEETIKQRNAAIEFENKNRSSKILGDKFHLTNTISNLIDNALKFNERNPIIRIKITEEERFITVSIIDNGIGIAKNNLNRVFETFFRVQSGNIQNVRGNGIGLSYVKKIIELHGGTISLESELNHGSTFRVNLPKQ